MNSPPRVVVIGGGITGLSAAWRIRQSLPYAALQLLEASPYLGGSLRSVRRDGFLMEMGPDCFISEKPRGLGLCRELGLESDLIETIPEKRRSFILRGGTFFPIPDGFYLLGPSRLRPFLESGLLSWTGKLRAMMEPLVPTRKIPSPSPLPQGARVSNKDSYEESLGSFVRRRFGQEMLDWMAQPLVAGIYGADPEDLSLRATFPQFLEMERLYGSVLLGLKKRRGATPSASGARYSLFLTLRGGMQTLTDKLAANLGSSVVQTQAPVQDIRNVEGTWKIIKASGEVLLADALCLALPSYAAAELLRAHDPDLAADLAGIAYAPAATINFVFRSMDIQHPLDGIGFVVPLKENRLVLGCTFVHNKFENRVPKGFMLLRAFLGGVGNTEWTSKKDEELTTLVFSELKASLGITGTPMSVHVQRYPQALPQYALGHLPRILRIEERALHHRGLALAGNWAYGVGIPDCIQAGERAADALATYLKRQEPALS